MRQINWDALWEGHNAGETQVVYDLLKKNIFLTFLAQLWKHVVETYIDSAAMDTSDFHQKYEIFTNMQFYNLDTGKDEVGLSLYLLASGISVQI